ncbi:SAM-dependent methyltransferase [Geobacter pickeringii]|uniref:SAM-dependent methyltransferase n=1 Tax=Geobacter pickeringii TaxID=345632 RepID=UPI000689255C|nr:class I SAM-dependent methyltransferase [Geobacter pickeringii]
MSDKMTQWDERYDTADFVYGREPNAFLAGVSDLLPPGDVLCLAEGEGRNAVFLAKRGHRVLAVDSSAVGLAKAARLAEESGVRIETVTADLADFAIEPGRWDAIVSIFCHLPPAMRRALHRQVVQGLRPGGIFVLEAYTPAQLALRTGGPPTEELMMTLAGLREELAGLEFLQGREVERDVVEGRLHTGRGAVVQIVCRAAVGKNTDYHCRARRV